MRFPNVKILLENQENPMRIYLPVEICSFPRVLSIFDTSPTSNSKNNYRSPELTLGKFHPNPGSFPSKLIENLRISLISRFFLRNFRFFTFKSGIGGGGYQKFSTWRKNAAIDKSRGIRFQSAQELYLTFRGVLYHFNYFWNL